MRGADEFRRNCDEARGISADDDVISVDEALINLRDEAIDEYRRARTHSPNQAHRQLCRARPVGFEPTTFGFRSATIPLEVLSPQSTYVV